jgi:hypothetical protein
MGLGTYLAVYVAESPEDDDEDQYRRDAAAA